MTVQYKTFAFEKKDTDAKGGFAGYLSVFGVMDGGRDIVAPGAFAESLAEWATKQKLPPVLWQHRSGEPIGKFVAMREDTKGLYVEGKLLLELQRAKEAHVLLENDVISGMSIGYETIGEEYDKVARIRKLTKLKLWEGSIVTFPMNEHALVDSVKSALGEGRLPDLPTFEAFLREAGFSKTQAAAVAGGGLSKLLRSESGNPSEIVKSAIETLRSINI